MNQPKVAIVTGGSSGIGRATALALAQNHFRVVVVGNTSQRVDATVQQLNAEAPITGHLGLTLDVTCEADMQSMADRTLAQFGRIDVLIASAAIGKKADSNRMIPYPTADYPLEDWSAILTTNLTGIFLSNRAVLPSMIAQGSGHILNIASATGQRGLHGTPFASAYCASKFGVVGFTQSVANEVEEDGVRVQVLFPGYVETAMTAQTTLARRYGGGKMLAEHVARSIVFYVEQPLDSMIIDPCLIPFVGGAL